MFIVLKRFRTCDVIEALKFTENEARAFIALECDPVGSEPTSEDVTWAGDEELDEEQVLSYSIVQIGLDGYPVRTIQL